MENNFKNKIINGDSLEELKKIPSETFDLVFADPPPTLTPSEKWNDFCPRTKPLSRREHQEAEYDKLNSVPAARDGRLRKMDHDGHVLVLPVEIHPNTRSPLSLEPRTVVG